MTDSARDALSGALGVGSSRMEAAGYRALADLTLGHRDVARAVADSRDALPRKWLFCEQTFWRAAIVGALGDRELSVQLLRQAHTEGQPMQRWHCTSALDALHGFAPFEALTRPAP